MELRRYIAEFRDPKAAEAVEYSSGEGTTDKRKQKNKNSRQPLTLVEF